MIGEQPLLGRGVSGGRLRGWEMTDKRRDVPLRGSCIVRSKLLVCVFPCPLLASRLQKVPMHNRSTASSSDADLQTALQTTIGPAPTRRAVRTVVDRCHRMACAYLRRQQRTGALREDVLGEDVDDLALDAISDLFARDADGQFPELQRYFTDRDLSASASPTAHHALRRLVMGTVTDWLFEAYRTADRSLSNAIRALKRVARSHDTAVLTRRGGTRWLEATPRDEATDAAPTSARGRLMPMETLEAHLTGALADNPTTEDLLNRALTALEAHPDYESGYPLTRLAQVLRAARVRVQAVTEHRAPVTYPHDPLFRAEEVEAAIERVIAALRSEKRPTYVENGPLDASTYVAYIQALRTRLQSRFVSREDAALPQHEALALHLDNLSREQYRATHRSRFEYLNRCARERLVERLQEAT